MGKERQPEDKRQVNPSRFLSRSERPSNLAILEQLTPHLTEAAREVADLFNKYPWITTGLIRIIGDAALIGEIELKRDPNASGNPPGQEIIVKIEGELGKNIPKIPNGTPFLAEDDAEVFLQPNPNKKPYAKTGDIVRENMPVLWIIYSKNNQFSITAPVTGRITYMVNNGQRVKGRRTVIKDGSQTEIPGDVLFYIEPEETKE